MTDEIADRCKFQPYVSLIGKARVTRRLDVGFFAPDFDAVVDDWSIIIGVHNLSDQSRYVRTRTLDDGSESARSLVDAGNPGKFFRYRLGQGDVRERAFQGREKSRHAVVDGRTGWRRVWINV